jgi:hypothetical protein
MSSSVLESLPRGTRELLLRTIHHEIKLCGRTTVGVHHAVLRSSRRLGFEPTFEVVVEARDDMHKRGAVSRWDGSTLTIWRAILVPGAA